jgi:hypothetical protein
VPNAREENVREEAAEEVVAGAEGAQEGRDLMEELPQREEEAAEEAANDVQDSGDMKEAGEIDDEEQEAKEDEGAQEEQTLVLALGKRTKALGALMQALTQGIKVGEKLAADDHDQGSEDTKEAGEICDEEQEAEEKDGEVKGQAALTTRQRTTAEAAPAPFLHHLSTGLTILPVGRGGCQTRRSGMRRRGRCGWSWSGRRSSSTTQSPRVCGLGQRKRGRKFVA